MIRTMTIWWINLRKKLRRLITRVIRRSVWQIVFEETIRQPLLLRYIQVRSEWLDRYEELFPGAVECSSRADLLTLAVTEAKERGVDGLWLEFGVWRGTSVNLVAEQISGTVYGFDSFEGLPVDWWHGDTKDSVVRKDDFALPRLPRVKKNVRLIKGWFSDTLPTFLREHEEKVSFVHIDSDVYESASQVLELLADRFVSGTIVVFDEFFNFPNWKDHEYKAFYECVDKHHLEFKYLAYNPAGEQVAIRLV